MNGSDGTILPSPSDRCAMVACANGNTDGDAADRAAELLTRVLFDFQSQEMLLLAEEEAQVR